MEKQSSNMGFRGVKPSLTSQRRQRDNHADFRNSRSDPSLCNGGGASKQLDPTVYDRGWLEKARLESARLYTPHSKTHYDYEQQSDYVTLSRNTRVPSPWAGGGASQQLDPTVHDGIQLNRAISLSLDTKKHEDKFHMRQAWNRWIVLMHSKRTIEIIQCREREIQEYRQALENVTIEARKIHVALEAARKDAHQAHAALEAARKDAHQAHAALAAMKHVTTHCIILPNPDGSLPMIPIRTRDGYITGVPIRTPSGSGFIIPVPGPNGLTLMLMNT